MGAIRGMFTSWVTSVLGGIAGVPLIIEGFASVPRNWTKIIEGIGVFFLGLAAKDTIRTGKA